MKSEIETQWDTEWHTNVCILNAVTCRSIMYASFWPRYTMMNEEYELLNIFYFSLENSAANPEL